MQLKIEKQAFEPSSLTCSKCQIEMKKTEMDINLEGGIFIKLSGFECSKCKKRYLGLGESRKLDKAMILSRIEKGGFKMERSLSFDGDNYTFRVPKDLTHNVHKKKIEIMPLGAGDFIASVR